MLQTANITKEIVDERRRQIEVEGYTPEQDDEIYGTAPYSDLCVAAASYALSAAASDTSRDHIDAAKRRLASAELWPWDQEQYKPKSARRDLIRAAALIVAEIERLDRAALTVKASA